jgi:hypothetical protein
MILVQIWIDECGGEVLPGQGDAKDAQAVFE